MKKKISLKKKLAFNKAAIAVLNGTQQQLLAGGFVPITNQPNCTTIIETCNTQPSPKEPCWYCQ
ncbi:MULTISPECIES: class I lanthipeptide [Chitinophaga]|uniref:Class I lanthipeptide n=1 Tax=Chitinophaga flava TaxID=2259036 RepID=A0A365XX48_9BACT|nr:MULTISPECIES: class I lanthipeptide [Chitinophaga]RBL90155.1 hypothetical protein DF182_27190 [Chitinophaga flava]